MIFLTILPIFSIIGVGLLANSAIQRFSKKDFNYGEIFLNSNVFGFSLVIFPMIFFGLENRSFEFVTFITIYSIVGLISSIYFLYHTIKMFFFNIDSIFGNITKNEIFFCLLTIIGVFIYFLYSMLLPLRGYDALWMYFPNSLLYYQSESIPAINLLNFMPTIKEPLNSLLYTYTLFITGEWAIQLIPFYFIILWAILTYYLAFLIFKNKKLAFFSFLVFLFFPANIWFIDNWAYYQDIFLGFFFTLTIFYILKMQNQEESNLYIVLASLSLALTLVSKLSGWTLFLIIPLLLKGNKKLRTVLVLYLLLLFSFLTFQGIQRIYIGIIPIFVLVVAILILHLWFNSYEEGIKGKLGRISIIYGIGTIIGGFWLFKSIEKASFLSDFLLNQYFNLTDKIKWNFVPPDEIDWIFEHAHSISFESIILILLISNLFGLFLALPKLRVVLHIGDTSPLIIWILTFFSIWIVYHSMASFRYLTPIFAPLVLIIVKGAFLLYESTATFFQQKQMKPIADTKLKLSTVDKFFTKKSIVIIIFLEIVSFYIPVIPAIDTSGTLDVNNIGFSYIKNSFFFYSNWFFILLIIVIIPAIFFTIIRSDSFSEKYYSKTKEIFIKLNNEKAVFVLLVLIITIPIFLPISIFIFSGYNFSTFQESYVFENRREYKEVIANIIAENNPRGGIITFNTPGLSIWTLQPVLDVFHQFDLIESFFKMSFISNGLNFLKYPLENLGNYEFQIDLNRNFSYVIIPNYNNYFYPLFLKNYRYQSYLFSILENQNFFKEIFQNDEFRVFRTIFSNIEYLGPYDVFLQYNNEKSSFLNNLHENISSKDNLEFFFPLDASMIMNLDFNITLITNYEAQGILNSEINDYTNNSLLNGFLTISKKLDIVESFTLHNFTIDISYIGDNLELIKNTYAFYSDNGLDINYYNNTYLIGKGLGLKILYPNFDSK